MAWFRAFREHGLTPAVWRIHRHIGMGGDQLVAAVAGDAAEESYGASLRDAEKRLYRQLLPEVCAFDGASDLIGELDSRGNPIILASSAGEEEVEHYIQLLGAEEHLQAFTTSDDVERTKPEPDLVVAAMEKAESEGAVMVGDSTWDVEAAGRAGLETVAVLTGGFSESELLDAGATGVYESLEDLLSDIESTPLAG